MSATLANGTARRIRDARPQARVAVTGTVTTARAVSVGGGPGFLCRLADGTGELDLLFLGRTRVAGLAAGARCAVEAMAGTYRGRLTAWNPHYRLISAEKGPGRDCPGRQQSATPRLDLTRPARRALAPR
jgi:hypothetical protein